MKSTPFFPTWRARLAPPPARLAPGRDRLRAATLARLEELFAAALPSKLFPKAPDQGNSRDRLYTRHRTFWSMLWQACNPGSSGREVVRQLQACLHLQDGPTISPADGAYCRAKQRLPLAPFCQALAATARAAETAVRAPWGGLQGRPLKLLDGSTITLPDTAANRAVYPAPHALGPSFPMLRIVVLFSLRSGALLAAAPGPLRVGELPLASHLFSQLARGDILLGDRGFGNFVMLALLQQRGIDFIGRCARRVDGRRRHQRLGRNDWLLGWSKGHPPSRWLSPPHWRGLPQQLAVRVVRGRISHKGFRVHQISVVTTLLDPQQYPAVEILQAYLRRWRLEMCLDDLKTTLEMDMLRSRSPQMAHKELLVRLITHNLIRQLMAQAAHQQEVSLEQISFKGSLDALRQFSQAIARARGRRQRTALWRELLRTLAIDLVPERPGRREPRAVKRKHNKYPRLSQPRKIFRDRPKRCVRQAKARLRRLALK